MKGRENHWPMWPRFVFRIIVFFIVVVNDVYDLKLLIIDYGNFSVINLVADLPEGCWPRGSMSIEVPEGFLASAQMIGTQGISVLVEPVSKHASS
jgi:hypothetical protein